LSSKNPGSEPVPRSSSKSYSSQTTKDAKKAVKKSLSHTSKEEEVDPAAMVEDVQRLLAAVSKEGKKQSREGKAMVAGDKRTFNMKDRDTELLKAMEDEEAIALEAEKVRFPFSFHVVAHLSQIQLCHSETVGTPAGKIKEVCA